MRPRGFHYRPLLQDERIEIAFLFQAGTVWPSWESVYEECISDTRFDVKIILQQSMAVETAHGRNAINYLENGNLKFVLYEDVDWENYRPHVVFIQFPYDASFHTPDTLSILFAHRGSRIVYIPYGMEIFDTPMARRDHFNSRVVEHAWRIYTSTEAIKGEYYKYCRNRQAVRVTGSPKFDSVYNKKRFSLSNTAEGAAANRNIILWKLHFPKNSRADGVVYTITPELDEYIDFANQLEDFKDFFFVVMPHPKMVGKMVASDFHGNNTLVEKAKKLFEILRSKDNVFIDVSDDYRNSLYNADAIIIDRSGVMVEAAMLGKPMLVMKNEGYDEPMIEPVRELLSMMEQGKNCADIVSFLEKLRAGDYQLEDRSKIIGSLFPYMDGKCGRRIVDDIKESVTDEGIGCKKVTVILYGAGEVASYYMKSFFSVERLKRIGAEIVAVADSDQSKFGKEFFGFQIISPAKISSIQYDYIVVMTEAAFYDIQKMLIYDYYLSDRTILRLDEFVLMLEETVYEG